MCLWSTVSWFESKSRSFENNLVLRPLEFHIRFDSESRSNFEQSFDSEERYSVYKVIFMDISKFIILVDNICLVLLAIAPTVFVFGVTLLGAAIEKSQQEEKSARENEAEKIQSEITKVEETIKRVRKGGDTKDLTDQLNVLIKNKTETEGKIKKIKIKYNRINLTNTVIYPCAAFLLSLLFSLGSSLSNGWLGFVMSTIEISLLVFGLIKLYLSLALIQEISVNKKESEYYDRLKQAIKLGVSEYEQTKKEEAEINFSDKKFPLNINPATDLKLDFSLNLKKGKSLANTTVWFFIPDGFNLIEPSEDKSWRQSSDYDPPNIRTVKIVSGTLNIGTRNPGHIKIKTPEAPGKYSIRCQINADGYCGETKDLKLIVG